MKSLWFIVPAHGRHEVARVCLKQLRWACDALTSGGIRASAVVVANDENLDMAQGLGFATYERENEPLGRKWNDGYELACREGGVDYVVPIGSDDWIDPAAILEFPLPAENEIRCFRRSAVVSEDGMWLTRLNITYDGGDGVRVIPSSLLEPFGYRPAAEDRKRAIDTSVWDAIRNHYEPAKRPRFIYHDLHPLQIVDFKSRGEQLNPYADCRKSFQDGDEVFNPWLMLGEHYPKGLVDEMAGVYWTKVPA